MVLQAVVVREVIGKWFWCLRGLEIVSDKFRRLPKMIFNDSWYILDHLNDIFVMYKKAPARGTVKKKILNSKKKKAKEDKIETQPYRCVICNNDKTWFSNGKRSHSLLTRIENFFNPPPSRSFFIHHTYVVSMVQNVSGIIIYYLWESSKLIWHNYETP